MAEQKNFLEFQTGLEAIRGTVALMETSWRGALINTKQKGMPVEITEI
jgi:hypothetical protein